MRTIAEYGSWVSPISAAQAAAASGGPSWTAFVGDEVWWVESRTNEGGRVALMRETASGREELLAAPWNVRNRVHEYGGLPWVHVEDSAVFTNWDDQRVYARREDGEIVPLTPEPAVEHGLRYADLRPGLPGEVWAVRESVTGPAPTDIARELVAIPVTGDAEPRVLAASHHFMTTPKLSPDLRRVAWLGWQHPDMPWDSTELCVADVRQNGTFDAHSVIAGGSGVSICQVGWESDESLLVLADPSGWWNLYRTGLSGDWHNVQPVDEEIGGPMWTIGGSWFAQLGRGRYAVLRSGRLAVLDEQAGTLTDVEAVQALPAWSASLAARDGVVVGVAAGPHSQPAVTAVGIDDGTVRQVSTTPGELPAEAYLPVPEERMFEGRDGEIPAFVYPPTNPDFTAPEGTLPPYAVHVHGGPTGRFSPVLNLQIAYLTSRGIGVVAVNYGGSAGYGRQFRERLRGQWGVVDIADCAAVAEALAAEGTADPVKLGIRGGSAGGYTSAASATMTKTYGAATIMFPVIDLLTFASGETHDFESRYLDGLVGDLPASRQRYVDRSPLTHVDSLACPVLLLQGLEDEICPPVQAERFVDSVAGKGIPHAYVGFEGEQHGFRRAENISAALEAEVSFYGQVFGFDTPGVPRLELRT
ncbi:MAG: prolyl oligopeptidase family serine peptidase [Actinophytocola sp.]|nr:prolyl oligopeptidase family serine peptidase [Actinophytocola sp.]